MGYVGNQTTTAFTSMDKQDIAGNGGPNYTLSHAVANANEIEVFVNNVRQEPSVAYSASGTTLTMTGNVASTDDFYVVYQGKAVGTIVTPDGSVSTAKIADDAVTNAKIADNAVVTASIADDAVTNAKIDTMAASKLTGALPALDGSALTGVSGGKVLQVLHFVSNSEKSTTSTSFAASGLFLDITPSATSSKIYAFMEFTMGSSANGPPEYQIYRGSTGIGGATKFQADANWNNSLDRGSLTTLDSPNTTSSTRYELYFRRTGTGAARIGRNHDGFVTNNATSITLMEIAG